MKRKKKFDIKPVCTIFLIDYFFRNMAHWMSSGNPIERFGYGFATLRLQWLDCCQVFSSKTITLP